MKQILVIYKRHYAAAQKLGEKITRWLCEKGCNAHLEEAGPGLVPDNCGLVIALGGDGTILGLARKTACKNLPILGINFGRVGFLCAVEANHWQPYLERLLENRLGCRSCLAISWKLLREGAVISNGIAANEIALNRGTLARLICVEIIIDNDCLGILRGDGLICCTPLGSSGYNVSAGGPLLYMSLDVLGITPVCPFLPNVKPLVTPGSASIIFKIHASSAECYLTIDGQDGQKLESGDRIEITGLKNAIHFLGDSKLYERLASRGLGLDQTP